MFTPESSEAALPMMFLLWFLWGAWPLARKQGGSGNAEFGLTYVLIQFLVTVLLCFSMGMVSLEGKRHFDERLFSDVMASELEHRPGAVLLSCLAGAMLCLGDFLMACAIDVFGVVVACPVGFGIALTAGSSLNYFIEPRADPSLLFPGVACCLMGMLCNAASHAGQGKGDTSVTQQSSCEASVSDAVPADEKGLEQTAGSTDSTANIVISDKTCGDSERQTVKPQWYVWLLPLVGGSCCASFGPISTAAATFGKLDPYAVYFAFMVGQLVTVLPMISVYSWVQASSDKLGQQRIWQMPCRVLRAYMDSCRQSPKGFTWNCMAGLATGSGYFMFFVGSPVVSRAVGFIFGCSGLLLSIVFGVFVFKEYKDASCQQKALVAFATLFLVLALGLMSVAGNDD